MNVSTANPVEKNAIVLYKAGWYRVSAKFSSSVNLAGIFSGAIKHKRVPLQDVREDYEAWSRNWAQSDSYRSM